MKNDELFINFAFLLDSDLKIQYTKMNDAGWMVDL